MKRTYRIFDHEGTALALPNADMGDLKHTFKLFPKIARVEVYEQKDDETEFQARYLKTYRPGDIKSYETQLFYKDQNRWISEKCSGGNRNGYDGNPYRYPTKEKADHALWITRPDNMTPSGETFRTRVIEVDFPPNIDI